MNNITIGILKTLSYFDVFNYPLTATDIFLFSSEKYDLPAIEKTLGCLVNEGTIFKFNEFYSLNSGPDPTDTRRKGNQRAITQIAIAERVAKFLSGFPFVQMIAVSGSLSKNFAKEDSDIDFFIITTANRLWIARTCMHLFKKLSFLVGKEHWFCMNYYIDEAGLTISEKNIFTAMEIVTLLPLQGKDCFQNFREANSWTNEYFTDRCSRFNGASDIKRNFIKNFIEKIFSSHMGDICDRWLMNLTDKRWKKKSQQKKVNGHLIRIGMMVGRHFSKPDPRNFQGKVIQEYESKLHAVLTNQSVFGLQV